MICKATSKDLEAILKITRACAKHMVSKGIFQWNEHYPSKEAFENDLERDELYVLQNNDTVIGCIVISTHMDDEYIPIQWLTPNEHNMYIHRLAVHPQYQGKGYAQDLMAYAEIHARKNHKNSIRLDTFSQNQRNQKFYEQRGYKKLGDIFFPKQSKYPFHCYELVL
ncbi:GNAT family N-acetyltransferase [Psychroserpens sp. Hel_I_66]|uniref:GNAT family N-acetyltransferase n=1 Tax=Psychroserpens sp. Hel_I_66 TaxID=1250004 RepID=UPI000647B8DE|nr:GNAT family N-acetyltransferase [Psychroserpens sp. Hel_I_66]